MNEKDTDITTTLHREWVAAAGKIEQAEIFFTKVLTVEYGVSNLRASISDMPNQPSPDKVVISVRAPRALKHRLKKLARSRKEKLTETIESIYVKATSHIELTPEDYRKIAEDTERAIKLASAKGAARKAHDSRFKGKKKAE